MERGNVLLETSMGDIVIELYWDHAPRTCANFYTLAKQGYYNGTIFHRIIAVLIHFTSPFDTFYPFYFFANPLCFYRDFVFKEAIQQEREKVAPLFMATSLPMRLIQIFGMLVQGIFIFYFVLFIIIAFHLTMRSFCYAELYQWQIPVRTQTGVNFLLHSRRALGWMGSTPSLVESFPA